MYNCNFFADNVKWWKVAFARMLDAAICNAMILYNKISIGNQF